MSEIYSPPNSPLLENESIELTFSSLGIWRKVYLILNWISVLLIIILGNIGVFFGEPGNQTASPLYFLSTFLMIYAIWAHTAIIGRRVTQLRVLCFIQIIPFLNPISAIIFWAISSTSKAEIQESQG